MSHELGMTPGEALEWVTEKMVPIYPLEDFKVAEELQGRRRGRR